MTRCSTALRTSPGAVPHTGTYALTNVTLPYAIELANLGWRKRSGSTPPSVWA